MLDVKEKQKTTVSAPALAASRRRLPADGILRRRRAFLLAAFLAGNPVCPSPPQRDDISAAVYPPIAEQPEVLSSAYHIH